MSFVICSSQLADALTDCHWLPLMSFVICSSQLADALSELKELKQRNHELEDQFANIRQLEREDQPKDALWDHIWQLEREDQPKTMLWKAEALRSDGVLPDPYPSSSRRIGHSARSLEAAPATAPVLYRPRFVQQEEVTAPVTTADAPVTTADAPVTAADAPVTAADAPVTTADAPVTAADAPVTAADAPVLYRLDLPADDLLYRLPTRRVGLVGGGDGTPKTRHFLNKRSAHASHAILPDRAEIISDRAEITPDR
jgi:hypothetical protein